LMETSGAMSGGGKTVTKGKMGTQVAGDDIDAGTLKRMEDDVRASEEEHRSAAREKTDSEDRMTIVSRELQATSNENEKLQVDIRALAEKAKNLKKQITAQEKVLSSAKTDENVLAELHKEEEKLQKIYDAQKEKVDDISHQVKKLNTKIKEVTGVKLKAISKRLEEARTKLDKVKSEITRLEVGKINGCFSTF
jgi:structural maintenance of chromosome 4